MTSESEEGQVPEQGLSRLERLKIICNGKFSLRTSTYFWAFMHIFLGVVFLLVCCIESYQYGKNEDELGITIYFSTPVASRKADLFIAWCYGLLYLGCGAFMFNGIHRERTAAIKCVLFIYVILEVCAIGFIKRLVNNKLAEFPLDTDFFYAFFTLIQVNLVMFFLSVQVFISLFYVINLIIFAYILQKSKAILQSNCSLDV